MKKLATLIITFIMIGSFTLTGCESDKEKVLKRTNTIYKDIKIIVTDPEIRPLIQEDTMNKLIEMERVYLVAIKKFESGKDGEKSIKSIADCAEGIILLIDDIANDGKYQKSISAIRLSVKLLRNHLN